MKRRVTPFYSGIYVIVSLSMIAASIFFLYLVAGDLSIQTILNTELDVAFWAFESIFLIGIILSIFEIIKGFSGAKYSVDADGMTTYLGKRSWHLCWADIAEYGVVRVKYSMTGSIALVYCTTERLTGKEKKTFLWHRKKSYDTTMYFQVCDQNAVSEFLSYIPEADQFNISYLLNQYMDWKL